MTGSPLVVLTLVASALVSWPLPSALPQAEGPSSARRPAAPRRRRALVVASGMVAVTVLLQWPWWSGVALAVPAALATLRIPGRRSGADRSADRHRLAVHADLLAACLEAGMSTGAALTAVAAHSADGDVGLAAARAERTPDALGLLDGVAALLLLGADPARAWASVQHHPDLVMLAAAAGRSSTGGATLAGAVREHAAHLRAVTADDSERAAGRAGVAMTAPLGLCFLPAFLCLGLAPVVVGLLSTLRLF